MTVTTLANPAEVLAGQLVAIACPVARAVAVSRLVDDFGGNLPRPIAQIRRDALQEARDAGAAVKDLAQAIKRSTSLIYQLTVTRRAVQSDPVAAGRARPAAQATARHISAAVGGAR